MNNVRYEKRRLDKPERMRREAVAKEFDDDFDRPLRQVDIVVAIQYYGITELLDYIGAAEIKGYLADR